MPILVFETFIATDPARCFDLARDIGLHCRTCAWTREEAVAGVTNGLIGMGQSVTFEANHLGLRRRLTSRIVAFEPPRMFVDQMQSGAFASLRHLHEFEPVEPAEGAPAGTLMRDTLAWTSPLGILGRIADALIVERHMARFLARRNASLKAFAERMD